MGFFRASSFDNALAILRQLAGASPTTRTSSRSSRPRSRSASLCHFFADGSFRWLRDRFAALPPWVQGALLARVALVLRELAHPKIVPFIYFQF